jgi:hypothetical protein
LVVEDGTTDLSISLYATEPSHVFILTDQAISVKLSGAATGIEVTGMFYLQGNVDAISVSNASGTDANVVIAFGV